MKLVRLCGVSFGVMRETHLFYPGILECPTLLKESGMRTKGFHLSSRLKQSYLVRAESSLLGTGPTEEFEHIPN